MSDRQDSVLELHVCQGLNACAGHGRNGTGTMAGDGDCGATANDHTCHEKNECRHQGGCGYFHKDKTGPDPGENSCHKTCGCGVPIPAVQVFKEGPNKGKSVWDHARQSFEKRMKAIGKTFAPAPAPNSRRKKLIQT